MSKGNAVDMNLSKKDIKLESVKKKQLAETEKVPLEKACSPKY